MTVEDGSETDARSKADEFAEQLSCTIDSCLGHQEC